MKFDPTSKLHLNRRGLLKAGAGAAGLGALGGLPGLGMGQMKPWEMKPSSSVDEISFVGWQYGEIYANIAKKF